MVKDTTIKVLQAVCAVAKPGEYIILSRSELAAGLPAGTERREIDSAMMELQADDYIAVRYSDGDVYCLTVQTKGFVACEKIKERDEQLQDAYQTNEVLEASIANLELRVAEQPKPEVVTREVVHEVEVVPEETLERIKWLEHLEHIHNDDNQKLRRQIEELHKKLDRAKVLLEEKGYEDNASWDISTLTSATNQYLRMYGGKLWAFDQFYRVDEVTQKEFERAVTNLAAFAQNVVQMISDKKMIGESNE